MNRESTGGALLEVLLYTVVTMSVLVVAVPLVEHAERMRRLRDAQSVVVFALAAARHEAQTLSSRAVIWNARSIDGQPLPEGVRIATRPGSVTYEAPYGGLSPRGGFVLDLAGDAGGSAKVALVGLTGNPRAVPIE